MLRKFVDCIREFPMSCLHVAILLKDFKVKINNHIATTCHQGVVITTAGDREVLLVNVWVGNM